MTDKSDNELIAEFMGFKYHEKADVDFSEVGGIYSRTDVYSRVPILMEKYPEANQFYLHEDWKATHEDYIYGPLQYQGSWDWLMPVVEKIETIALFQCIIGPYYVKIRNSDPFQLRDIAFIGTQPGEPKIVAIYKAVVEFIKWYNSQNP